MEKGGKIAIGVTVGFVVATVGWTYLAGFLYLLFSKLPTAGVTMWTFLQYWEHYGAVEAVHKKLVLAGAAAGTVTHLIPLLLLAAAMRNVRELHGSARFATAAEIEKSGLHASKGIIVGKRNKRYLMFSGQQFVLLAAPTRSGKGVSTVIPNLLNYDGSVVVLDVKQENYDITAGFQIGRAHV